jgi:DNA-directed RNA polymerase subunit E'/Rpb7
MASIKILEKRIVLESKYLDHDYMKSIKDRLEKVSLNSCSKEEGHVLEIHEITEIVDNYISNVNSEIVFIVKFKATVLKPEIGVDISDKVCMIFSGGLFMNIRDKFQVLIPFSSLESKNYVFQPENKTYFNSETKSIIAEGQECKIKISSIRFVKKNFKCFGELVDVL